MLYRQVVEEEIKGIIGREGMRVLEYGCGGGMNLIHLLSMYGSKGIKIDRAYGTDFSPVLIEAANKEADKYLPSAMRERTAFLVAKNETLIDDISRHTGRAGNDWKEKFHLILGVNTFRYCFRLRKERESAQQIHDLLMPGGVSIMIDMNDKFPFFRSKMKNNKNTDSLETYIPPLSEYARPFREAGLKIVQQKHFCWIHHSASSFECAVLHALSPLLQALFQDYAMRSLVVAKKI
jgi:SAM-dependent methyltransferase